MRRSPSDDNGPAARPAGAAADTVRVWDPFVRLSHWLIVATFTAGYITQERHYDLHLFVGYALLAVVAARLIWGLAGSRHARFSDFVYAPRTVLDDLARAFTGGRRRYLGHTPAGD